MFNIFKNEQKHKFECEIYSFRFGRLFHFLTTYGLERIQIILLLGDTNRFTLKDSPTNRQSSHNSWHK